MKRINLLDESTSNKIAAGEVVERPFSVVKELVENSIDAGATNISIEIIDGGETMIKILDNGSGIYPDDIEKAFMPHATSKIKDIRDIFSINTLGFRGEALASIAAVSNVVLKSKVEDEEFGKEIAINAGKIEYIRETGCNKGTSIEVKNLFFNVPARKKFLKSSRREAALISDIITRLSLANPNISFKLINNGKVSITTYASENFKDTIRHVYGKKACDNIINFEGHNDLASIYGYVGNAELSRGSRNNQSIFINKRYVKNKLITVAVENAVKSFLMINKFPFFILFLDIFPEYVDVNVHPTKSEIKFQEEREIFKLVFGTVHEALKKSIQSSFQDDDDNKSENNNLEHGEIINESHEQVEIKTVQIPIDLNNGINDFSKEQVLEQNSTEKNTCSTKEEKYNFPNFNDKNQQSPYTYVNETTRDKEYSSDYQDINKNHEEETKEAKFAELTVIGQLYNTYILTQGPEGLYIIDQHAAHEKVLFEKYRDKIKNSVVISQILISPLVLELSPDDFIIYSESVDIFKKAGFNIEIFGENTITIREVPMFLGKPDIKNLFMSILDNLKNMGSGETIEVKYNKIATLACKAAVKAHDRLSENEMKALLEDLRYIQDPFNCPHGRPTIVKITLNELEKRFKRIQ